MQRVAATTLLPPTAGTPPPVAVAILLRGRSVPRTPDGIRVCRGRLRIGRSWLLRRPRRRRPGRGLGVKPRPRPEPVCGRDLSHPTGPAELRLYPVPTAASAARMSSHNGSERPASTRSSTFRTCSPGVATTPATASPGRVRSSTATIELSMNERARDRRSLAGQHRAPKQWLPRATQRWTCRARRARRSPSPRHVRSPRDARPSPHTHATPLADSGNRTQSSAP